MEGLLSLALKINNHLIIKKKKFDRDALPLGSKLIKHLTSCTVRRDKKSRGEQQKCKKIQKACKFIDLKTNKFSEKKETKTPRFAKNTHTVGAFKFKSK